MPHDDPFPAGSQGQPQSFRRQARPPPGVSTRGGGLPVRGNGSREGSGDATAIIPGAPRATGSANTASDSPRSGASAPGPASRGGAPDSNAAAPSAVLPSTGRPSSSIPHRIHIAPMRIGEGLRTGGGSGTGGGGVGVGSGTGYAGSRPTTSTQGEQGKK